MNCAPSPTEPGHHDLLNAAANAVQSIIDRAKRDRKGAYWPLAVGYRQGDARRYECSLGVGTPGILLALLHYYRASRNAEIAELIRTGAQWLQHRTAEIPLRHGLFFGEPGIWLLWAELDREFPGSVDGWRTRARDRLASDNEPVPAGIGYGAAGTVVGLLAALTLPADEEQKILGRLQERIVTTTGLAPQGVFWDYHPTSIQPPLGFLYGNAGVDYSLVALQRRLGRSGDSLLTGSLGRASAAFDRQHGCWPDFDAMTALRHATPRDFEQAAERLNMPVTPEYSLGWGNGLVGILLARLAVAGSEGDATVRAVARADVSRALERLDRATEAELTAMDDSMQFGLSGIALALDASTPRLRELGLPTLDTLRVRVRQMLGARRPIVQHDDVSLLTGTAGYVYAAAKPPDEVPRCVDPMGGPGAFPAATAGARIDLAPLLSRRLPACSSKPQVEAALQQHGVSLEVVRCALATEPPAAVDDRVSRSIQHGLEVQSLLAGVNFRERFFHELAANRRSREMYGPGREENLQFARFRLDGGVSLLALDFDPYEGRTLAAGERLLLLRQLSSQGVVESKLSALQFALLEGFRGDTIALEVIARVVDRVQTPNVAPRQLAALSLNLVRTYASAGCLVPVAGNVVSGWCARRRLKQTRIALFPANGTP